MSGQHRRLRIAQVAPVAAPVTPTAGDSVEQLVSALTEGLVARGHEVTLYATGDSVTSARLRSVHPSGYDSEEALWDWYRAESFHAAAAFEHAADHDVIHAHDFHFALPFSRLTATPLIETAHTEVAPEVLAALEARGDVHLIAVSEHTRRGLPRRDRVTVIPHGIDFDAFALGDRPESYLLFLGRMIADKGPADAVRVAEAAGLPIILAGPADPDYDLRAQIGPDRPEMRWVGPVGPAERNRLLAGALALVFPVVYPEPFGLVLIEAMACGTPALATARGATVEIVEQGVTGYTAASWQELPGLVAAAARLDRRRVREQARKRFDQARMVDRHEALYHELTARSRTVRA